MLRHRLWIFLTALPVIVGVSGLACLMPQVAWSAEPVWWAAWQALPELRGPISEGAIN